MTTKLCPVRGCGCLIRARAVLCSECYKRLPHDTQRAGFYGAWVGWPADQLAEAVAYLNVLPPLPTKSEERVYG